MPHTAQDSEQQTLSVTQLTAQIKNLLEGNFTSVWVAGEISNLSRPQSGHCYLTLKDDKSQIRGVLWRSTAGRIKFDLADGLDVICHGHLDVYAPRGSYQLVIDRLEPQGLGSLELALRKLREKLAAEGLFDRARKRPLPAFPRRIGFVTSPTGAAIQDFLEVLRRRWHGTQVLVIPARVQGTGASREIAAGIKAANRITPALDVLVVGRGGGSLEDLWCFNEEAVVRTLAASKIPTVSAVGHEIDVTLADLAADVRALTPSEAAEKVVPAGDEIALRLGGYQSRLNQGAQRYLQFARSSFQRLAERRTFSHPYDMIFELARRLDELATDSHQALLTQINEARSRFTALDAKLEALSPLGVLDRGYSITQDAKTGKVIRSSSQVKTGQQIRTRLSDGSATSVVDEVAK